jgi:MFS family permease
LEVGIYSAQPHQRQYGVKSLISLVRFPLKAEDRAFANVIRTGRKPILLIANFVFFVGSLLAAVSVSAAMLIAARCIQGIGGGGLMVLVNICIGDLFSMRYVMLLSFLPRRGSGRPLRGLAFHFET